MDGNFSSPKIIIDEMPSSSGNCMDTEPTQPKQSKKVKELPPRRVQRSRSCSSLCKRQPIADLNAMQEKDTSSNEPSNLTPDMKQKQHVSMVMEEEVDGNELVELLKSKFTISSPKLSITNFVSFNHTGENISTGEIPSINQSNPRVYILAKNPYLCPPSF